MTTVERSVAHGTFNLERVYAHPPERVYAVSADAEAVRTWLVEGEGWEVESL